MMALRHLEDEAYADINKMLFQRMCSAISNPMGIQEKVWDASAELLDSYVKHVAPWIKLESKEDLQDRLRKSWEKVYGDSTDPEVATAIEETAKALVEQANLEIAKASPKKKSRQ